MLLRARSEMNYGILPLERRQYPIEFQNIPIKRSQTSTLHLPSGQARHFMVVLEVVIDYAPYEAGYPGYQDLLSQTKPRF
jgi:hypothetical protein